MTGCRRLQAAELGFNDPNRVSKYYNQWLIDARAALVQANVVGRNMWEGVRWARMGALRGDANELAVSPKMVYMVVEARVVGAVGVRDPPVVDHGALVVVQGLPTIKFPMSRGQDGVLVLLPTC